MPFDRDRVQRKVTQLAEQGVWIGTSSWKYPGWFGKLYDESRYVWRGRFSKARFEKGCLAEYAEVFKTVCMDAMYYRYPSEGFVDEVVSQVPVDFLFTFKVTDEITIKHFTNLPRFGARAGKDNANFLNAELFKTAFLKSLEPHRQQFGLLIFEFAHFSPRDFERGRDFVAALDEFLGKLPKGWPYGVEIRNRNFLHPEYFEALRRHGVAHVYNSWTDMPPVSEQMAMPGSRTNPNLCGARFLLKPGRTYEEAVKLFSPYNRLQEPNLEGRAAAVQLIKKGKAVAKDSRLCIHLGNRFEGNSLESITAVLEEIEERASTV